MNELLHQKQMLKNLRNYIQYGDTGLNSRNKKDLVIEVNVLIGVINIDLAKDAKDLDRLSIEDGIKNVK